MGKVILITGGARSGKSSFGERLALSLASNPVYMATARVSDDEFRLRVQAHQERRGSMWDNIEEDKLLSRHDVRGRVVLVDCLTLWASNFFFDLSANQVDADDADGGKRLVAAALEEMKGEFDRFTSQEATFLFVTNEIGSGGVSPSTVQRRFTDLTGWLNQYVAARADEVYLLVCGIPLRIKP